MAHTLASLKKLLRSDLAIDYQNRFGTLLNNVDSELLNLKK